MIDYPLVHGIHPHPEAIRQAMLAMSAGLEMNSTPVEVEMDTVHIEQEPCKTVCCHAGMYALGKALLRGTVIVPSRRGTGLVAEALTGRKESSYIYLSYLNGVAQLTTDLGFSDSAHLENWAWYFTSLWGSDHGEEMFTQARAFFSPADLGAGWTPSEDRSLVVTPEIIISWWFDVADRVERFMKEYGYDQELDEDQYIMALRRRNII